MDQVIENGTLVEIHAGTFRAFLGTVRGAQEIVPDGGTSWVAYSIERSNGRMETVTGDAVTVVPE